MDQFPLPLNIHILLYIFFVMLNQKLIQYRVNIYHKLRKTPKNKIILTRMVLWYLSFLPSKAVTVIIITFGQELILILVVYISQQFDVFHNIFFCCKLLL